MNFKKWSLPLLLTMVMVTVAWLAVSDQSPVHISAATNDPLIWSAGWQAEEADGSLHPLALPARLSPGENTVVNALPSALPAGTMLYLKTGYQQVSAEVGGQAIPVRGIVSVPGNRITCDQPWSVVPLAPDMAGKTIRLRFSGTGSKLFIELYDVRMGSTESIRLALLYRCLPTLIISLLIVFFALCLFAFALLVVRRRDRKVTPGYYALIVFLFFASVWFYTDTDISGVSYQGSQAFFLVNLFSYLLMPIPFLHYVGFARPSLKPITRFFCVLLFADVLAQLGLLITGRYVLWVGLTASHVLLALACITLLVAMIRRHYLSALDSELSLGVGVAAVSGLITVALFYLYPVEDNTSVFRYGVLVLVFGLCVSVFRANVDSVVQAKRMEQLRVQEEEYSIVVRQSPKQLLRYDVASRTLQKGETEFALFGDAQNIADFPESILADGYVADGSVEDFRSLFSDIRAGRPYGSTAVCLRGAKGDYPWYHVEYTLIYTSEGQPLQAVIALSDITEQRQSELVKRKWKQAYTAFPPADMNYYEYNLTRNTFIEMSGEMLPPISQQAQRSLDLAVNEVADHNIFPEDGHRFRAFLERERLLDLYESGIRLDRLEFRRLGADGHPLWTLANLQLSDNPVTRDIMAFLLLSDEDDARRKREVPNGNGEHDTLTGLSSRAAFEKQFAFLLEHSEINDVHALVCLDVDGMRRVNDAYGHIFGDRVLTELAASLKTMTRSGDIVGRVDGDQFLFCLSNTRDDARYLEKRAAFLCQGLRRQFGNGLEITVSMGIALYPRDGSTFQELFEKSAMALYYAKRSGNSRYIFFHNGLMKPQEQAGDEPDLYDAGTLLSGSVHSHGDPERTLLIVNDEEETKTLLEGIFQRDYRLLSAATAVECMDHLSREKASISAILLDLCLNGTDGLELFDQIQKKIDPFSIPIIVTSTAGEGELGMRAVEMGATDLVYKPFNPRLVRLRVKNAIHKRETESLRAQNRYLIMQKNDEQRHQNELRYIAEHDPLTNICNKAAFYRKTRLMLDKSPDAAFVMITFDIEKFRLINDIFGHTEGDRLLRFIAQRMQNLYAGVGTYARIDADNFALCLPYDPELPKKHLADNDRNMKDYDLPFEILLVYGLYIIDDRTLPVSIMHDRAEMAKRTVKGNYVNRYAYYDDQLRKSLLDEQQIINDMNDALQQKQFEIYLQPKCIINTGEIVGAEALVRWNHPTRGLLMPGKFVPIFEKNGFIMKMDAYVWEQVCALMRRWMDQNAGKPPLPVSMNVSRVNIYNPALVGTLCQLAERYRVPRRYIELEITESAYTENPKQLSELIAELRREGFTVEMDDFGSAYSSLNMLKEISVDMLKLDMRFLYGNDQDGRGGTILNSIVRMARYLALPIVVEGVETAAQSRFLSSIGCMFAQGYYYYKPMRVPDFEALLTTPAAHAPHGLRESFPESAVRRVWSIDGDFSLMLSTIPCAASLCELSGDTIELLRINEEYLVLTGDRTEHIYRCGKNVQALTTNQEYQRLLTLFAKAFETQGAVESDYLRISQDGVQRRYRIKVKFLSGDTLRSLYFITYMPATDPLPSGEAMPPLSLCPPPPLPLTRQAHDPEK